MTKKTIRNLESLTKHNLVSASESQQLKKVVENFSVAITDQMQQLIDRNNPDDPIAKQFVPSIQELNVTAKESADPVGDEIYTKTKGIIHRYPDRCLFTPVHVCPVYCRFCFRKQKVGTPAETLTPDEIEAALAYIAEHKEIWEVIITGGDPLILKPAVLKNLLVRLSAIEHVEMIRIHSRVPVVDSQRINSEMLAALKCAKPVFIVLHANHPQEFSAEAIKACANIIDNGIPMLSQSVLLKDLNDNIEVLSQLMRCFIKNRIKPYYLHHGDLALGTEHFRTTIAKGQQLLKQLRGRFSGICQPIYVLDIPGGFGKVPINPNYLNPKANEEDSYIIEDYRGHFHEYSPR
jgi:lysine 2,3-aminomutase